jgi:hypothetical protein
MNDLAIHPIVARGIDTLIQMGVDITSEAVISQVYAYITRKNHIDQVMKRAVDAFINGESLQTPHYWTEKIESLVYKMEKYVQYQNRHFDCEEEEIMWIFYHLGVGADVDEGFDYTEIDVMRQLLFTSRELRDLYSEIADVAILGLLTESYNPAIYDLLVWYQDLSYFLTGENLFIEYDWASSAFDRPIDNAVVRSVFVLYAIFSSKIALKEKVKLYHIFGKYYYYTDPTICPLDMPTVCRIRKTAEN